MCILYIPKPLHAPMASSINASTSYKYFMIHTNSNTNSCGLQHHSPPISQDSHTWRKSHSKAADMEQPLEISPCCNNTRNFH